MKRLLMRIDNWWHREWLWTPEKRWKPTRQVGGYIEERYERLRVSNDGRREWVPWTDNGTEYLPQTPVPQYVWGT